MKHCPSILIILLFFVSIKGLTQSNTFQPYSFNSQNQPVQVSPQEISKRLYYAQSIFEDSLNRSLRLVEENLTLAIRNNFKQQEALAHQILGEFNLKLKNYAAAIPHLEKAVKLYNILNLSESLYTSYDWLGTAHSNLNQPYVAIENWTKAEQLRPKDKQKRIATHLKLGEEYLKVKNYESSRLCFQKAADLAESINDKENSIAATIGLGKVNEMLGANKNAEELFQQANQTAIDIQSVELTNSSLNSLSNLYQNENNVPAQMRVQQEAIDFNLEAGNAEIAVLNTTQMANTLIEEGQDEKALALLNRSVEMIDNSANTKAKRNFYKTLSKAYEVNGDLEKSKELEGEYLTLMDSFKILEAQKQDLIATKNDIIENTETKISLLEKDRLINEKTIQLLQQDQLNRKESMKNQRIIMLLLVLGLILVVIIIFFIYRNNKEKQKSNQLLMLKSLRNQMNPHFIFNSLNSVNIYIAQQDERAANKYLADFSKLMRAVLNYSQHDFIPLSKEIEILTLYLNLEHDRFKEHFDFSIDCPKKIPIEDVRIPPMLLQPLVENAIWHGLRYKPEKGFLKIEFSKTDDHLKIVITDNGIGRAQSRLHKTDNQLKRKSTGIKNVQDRLAIIKTAFKKELSIEINDLDPATKEGTVATVLLKI